MGFSGKEVRCGSTTGSTQQMAQGPQGSLQGNHLRASHVELWMGPSRVAAVETGTEVLSSQVSMTEQSSSLCMHLAHLLCTRHWVA